MKERIISLPNFLSFIRLPLAVLLVVSLDSWMKYLVLAIAVASDGLDGYAARKMHLQTKLGALLDPLFDKMFVLIVFLFIFFVRDLPAYTLLFFLRDVCTLLGAMVLPFVHLATPIEIKARFSGKVVTCLQFLVLLAMVHGSADFFFLSIILLIAASVVSIAEYGLLLMRSARGGEGN